MLKKYNFFNVVNTLNNCRKSLRTHNIQQYLHRTPCFWKCVVSVYVTYFSDLSNLSECLDEGTNVMHWSEASSAVVLTLQ